MFHTERTSDGLANIQNDLPILCAEDKAGLKALARDFEIDFISLSFTRHSSDVEQAREFLRSVGLDNTKVCPWPCALPAVCHTSGYSQ